MNIIVDRRPDDGVLVDYKMLLQACEIYFNTHDGRVCNIKLSNLKTLHFLNALVWSSTNENHQPTVSKDKNDFGNFRMNIVISRRRDDGGLVDYKLLMLA